MSLFSNETLGPSGGVIQTLEPLGLALTAASATQIFFICPDLQRWEFKEMQTVFGTASSSGTVQVELDKGTTAVGSGTNLTGAVALSGTANTVVVTPATSSIVLNPGDRIALKFAGTMTGLADGFVQLTMLRVSF
jgi:hypothetical protein